MANDYAKSIGIMYVGAAIVVSFGIYAFGEVVEILHDIRRNTKISSENVNQIAPIINDAFERTAKEEKEARKAEQIKAKERAYAEKEERLKQFKKDDNALVDKQFG